MLEVRTRKHMGRACTEGEGSPAGPPPGPYLQDENGSASFMGCLQALERRDSMWTRAWLVVLPQQCAWCLVYPKNTYRRREKVQMLRNLILHHIQKRNSSCFTLNGHHGLISLHLYTSVSSCSLGREGWELDASVICVSHSPTYWQNN